MPDGGWCERCVAGKYKMTAGGEASRPRYLFAPAYNTVPDLVNTVERSVGSYGRALDVHHERARVDGREGLRG